MQILKILLVLILGCFLLTGCWDAQEITELAAVTGLGIDPGSQPNTITFTIQISPPNPTTSAGGAGGGSRLRVISVEVSTLAEAITELHGHTRREPFYQHLGFVVFGEEMAKAGIAGVISALQGEPTIRGSVPVFVSVGPASEVLQAHSAIGRTPGQDVADLLANIDDASLGRNININDVINTLSSFGSELALPILELRPLRTKSGDERPDAGVSVDDVQYQEIYLERTALFIRDRWVHDLDLHQTQVFVLLSGASQEGSLVIPNPSDPNGLIAIVYESFSPSYKPEVSDGGATKLKVEVKTTVRIVEIRGFYDLRQTGFDPINRELSEVLSQQVADVMQVLQEHGSDALGIGQGISRKRPKDWSKIEPQWEEQYAAMQTQVMVKAEVIATNLIAKFFEIKR